MLLKTKDWRLKNPRPIRPHQRTWRRTALRHPRCRPSFLIQQHDTPTAAAPFLQCEASEPQRPLLPNAESARRKTLRAPSSSAPSA
ncbi:MAG: hypothetical protein K2L11_10220 [Muribaculaceae bacterium]|nr:hypothetical protein [Muribaculaceae bacterium]